MVFHRVAGVCGVVLLARGLTSVAAQAAQIWAYPDDQKKWNIVLNGTLDESDDAKFTVAASNQTFAYVWLNSIGGQLTAGLKIAELIQARKYQTVVAGETTCSSMCGLVWPAGSPRWILVNKPTEPPAKITGPAIGFHAIYNKDKGDLAISSAGNAVVGAYLAGLGFNQLTIRYLTQTPPDSMEWLSGEKAKQYGIKYEYAVRDFATPYQPKWDVWKPREAATP